MGMKWYLIVVLIYIFQRNSEVEHLFICFRTLEDLMKIMDFLHRNVYICSPYVFA